MKIVQQLISRSTLLLATAAITAGLLGGCQANNTMKGGAIGAGARHDDAHCPRSGKTG